MWRQGDSRFSTEVFNKLLNGLKETLSSTSNDFDDPQFVIKNADVLTPNGSKKEINFNFAPKSATFGSTSTVFQGKQYVIGGMEGEGLPDYNIVQFSVIDLKEQRN